MTINTTTERPLCNCKKSDAWRCAVEQRLSTIHCTCPCHIRSAAHGEPSNMFTQSTCSENVSKNSAEMNISAGSAEQVSNQAKFEKWATDNGFPTRLRNDTASPDTYFSYETEQRWIVWQACSRAATERKALSDDQLDYIARSYFANKRDQESVKHAIHDAFKEEQASAQSTDAGSVKDAEDAARWRALLASDRIRILGSAGIVTEHAENYAHFGMEIWTKYGRPGEYDFSAQNTSGAEILTKYADIAIAEQANRAKAKP